MTNLEIIEAIEEIISNIEGDSYTADELQTLIEKIKTS